MNIPQAGNLAHNDSGLWECSADDPHPGLTAARKMKAAAEIIGKLDTDDLRQLLTILGVVPCAGKQERVEQMLVLLGGDIHSLRSLDAEEDRWRQRATEAIDEVREPAPTPVENVLRYLIQARVRGQPAYCRPFIVGPPLTNFEKAMNDASALPADWDELYVLIQDGSGRIVRQVKVRE